MKKIKKEKERDFSYRNRLWLEVEYKEKQRTLRQIAEGCGVSAGTVLNWIKKFKIKTRSSGRIPGVEYKTLDDLRVKVRRKEERLKEYQKIKNFMDGKEKGLSMADRRMMQRRKRIKEKAAKERLEEKRQRRQQNKGSYASSVPGSMVDQLYEWQKSHDEPIKR